jgi:hydroxymethylbilane synthase
VDGKQMLVETANGSRNDAEALGKKLASQLIAHGADQILAAL